MSSQEVRLGPMDQHESLKNRMEHAKFNQIPNFIAHVLTGYNSEGLSSQAILVTDQDNPDMLVGKFELDLSRIDTFDDYISKATNPELYKPKQKEPKPIDEGTSVFETIAQLMASKFTLKQDWSVIFFGREDDDRLHAFIFDNNSDEVGAYQIDPARGMTPSYLKLLKAWKPEDGTYKGLQDAYAKEDGNNFP